MVKYAHNALLCLEFFNFWDWYVYRDGKNKQKGVYIRNISPDVNLFPMSPYSTFPTAKLDKRARSPIHPKTQITVDGNGLKKPIRNRIFCNLLFFLLRLNENLKANDETINNKVSNKNVI